MTITKCYMYYDYYVSGLCQWNGVDRYFIWSDGFGLAEERIYSVFDVDHEPSYEEVFSGKFDSLYDLVVARYAKLGEFSSGDEIDDKGVYF